MATKKPVPAYQTQTPVLNLEAGEQFLASMRQAQATEAPTESRGMLRAIADTGLSFGRGAVTGVRMLSDVAGADNAVSGALRSVDDYLGELQSAQAKGDQQRIAQIMKDAENKGVLDQVIAGAKAFAQAPVATTANALGTSIPTLATAMLPGGPAMVAARLGTMGAAQGAGSVKGSIYETVKAELIQAGATPQEAEQRAAQQQSYAESGNQIVQGAALGVLAGTTGAERLVGGLTRGVAGKAVPGTARRVGMGAATEALPEAAQGAQEKYATNTALYQQGFDQAPGAGVVAAGTMEGLAGGIVGGAMAVPTPKEIIPPAPAPAPAPIPAAAGFTPAKPAGPLTRAATKAQPAALGWNQLYEPEGGFAGQTPLYVFPDGSAATRDEAADVISSNNALKNIEQWVARSPRPMAQPEAEALAMAASIKAGKPMTSLPLPDGSGWTVVPQAWVDTPAIGDYMEQATAAYAVEQEKKARKDAIMSAPVDRAPRTPKAPEAAPAPMPDLVDAYVESRRAEGTPAGREFAREYQAGRITRADVKSLIAQAVPKSPDQRLAEAAAQAPKETAQPGDILNAKGKPFTIKPAAVTKAKESGGSVIQVDGGFVVRPKASAEPEPKPPKPTGGKPKPEAKDEKPTQRAEPPADADVPALKRAWNNAVKAGDTEGAARINDRIVAAKAKPAEAPAAPAAPKADDKQALEEKRQMVADMIATKKANREAVPEAWVKRLADLSAQVRGEKADDGATYSMEVAGHPMYDGPVVLRNLVPIKVKTAEDAQRALDRALDLERKAATEFYGAKQALKAAKTPAEKRAAQARVKKLNDQGWDEDALKTLREETIGELSRLVDTAPKAEVQAAPPPAPAGETKGESDGQVQGQEQGNGQGQGRETLLEPTPAASAPAEPAPAAPDDDYITALFGTPAEQAAAQERATAAIEQKKQGMARVRSAIAEQQKRAKAEHDEWAGKVYKKNKTQVELNGDGPSSQVSMSIGAINESRRRNAMEALTQELKALDKLADAVSTDSGAERVAANLADQYAKATKIAADGNGLFKTADEQFQYMLLDDLKMRGPGGKGNVTSNGLSKAMLAAVKGDSAPAAPTGNLPAARQAMRAVMQRIDALNDEFGAMYRDNLPYFTGDGPTRKLSPSAPPELRTRWDAYKKAKKQAQADYDAASARVTAATPAPAPAPAVAPPPPAPAPAPEPEAPKPRQPNGSDTKKAAALFGDKAPKKVRELAEKRAAKEAEKPSTQGAIDAFNADDHAKAVAIMEKLKLADLQEVGAAVGFRPQIGENATKFRERIGEVADRLTKTAREKAQRQRVLFDKLNDRAMEYDRAADHAARAKANGVADDSTAYLGFYRPMGTAFNAGATEEMRIPALLDKLAADVASLKEDPDYAEVSAMVRKARPRVFEHQAKAPEAAPQAEAPKLYKSRKAAELARRELGNTHRLRKVQGGYILREATDKELAAADRAGRRLSAGRSVDVENDSLLTAIAKLGGISMAERADTIGSGNRNIGGQMLFQTGGRDIDSLATEILNDLGYIPAGVRDDPTNWLRSAIKSEFMGGNTYYSERGTEWMEDRMREMEAEEAPDFEDVLADFTPDDLAESGYTGADAAVQAATEELLIAAEAAGIDTEGLREDAARATDTEDAYHAEVQRLAREALAAAGRRAGGTDPEAARGSAADSGQVADEEGAQEGLTLQAQTADDLRAKAAREEAAAKAEKSQRAAEQERLRREAEARDNKARADATVDDFQLGQPADRQMSGMGDIFDQPDSAPAPAKPDRPEALIEARKRLSVLNSLRKCIGG